MHHEQRVVLDAPWKRQRKLSAAHPEEGHCKGTIGSSTLELLWSTHGTGPSWIYTD